jgi:tetratricopeptide (TPR) repeat protein
LETGAREIFHSINLHPMHLMKKTFVYILLVVLLSQSLFVLQGQSAPDTEKPKLVPVPVPSLEALEPSVVDQIQDVQNQLRDHALAESTPQAEITEAFGLMGKVYHAYEFFDAAEACYTNASQLASDQYQWPHLLGVICEQKGDLEKAADYFEQANTLEPSSLATQIRLGRVYLVLNKREEARQLLEGIVNSGIESAATLQTLGELALAEEQYEQAAETLQQALKMRPEANRLYYLLGMAYRGLKQMELAEQVLEKSGVVGIRPSDPLLDELPDLLNGERVYLIRGHVAYRAERYQEAIDAFTLALEAEPESVRALINLASAYEKIGNREQAKKWFLRALAADPDNFNAHFNLGVVLKQENLLDESIMHLRRAHEIQPNDVQAQWEWIQAMHANGMTDQAIRRLYALAAKASDEEEVALQLALYLGEAGRQEEVKYVLTQAHLRFPDRGRTTVALARFLATCPNEKLRDGAAAVPLAVQAYNSQPTLVHAETVVLALIENDQRKVATKFIEQVIQKSDVTDPVVLRLNQVLQTSLQP